MNDQISTRPGSCCGIRDIIDAMTLYALQHIGEAELGYDYKCHLESESAYRKRGIRYELTP